MNCIIVCVVALFAIGESSFIVEPGPEYKATKGEVWPAPAQQNKTDDYLIVQGNAFQFTVVQNDCQLLQNALIRYWKIINHTGSLSTRGRLSERKLQKILEYKKEWLLDEHFKGYLSKLYVVLNGKCDDNALPLLHMDEKYTLDIWSKQATLTADTIWGIMRGLETFSQLIYMGDDYLQLQVNVTYIKDYPRFSHRGLMLDTSRHFIPLPIILQTIDAMSYNKLNVFHWHITDDQSFPYVSQRFPEISKKGAYHPVSKVYEPDDVQNVIEYARQRGIRVVPEYDSPGHTRSWGVAMTDLLTPCYNGTKPTGQYGPVDPTKDATYTFLQEFFAEVVQVYKDPYVHFGGDEVDFSCWESNPQINEFMNKLNISGDYAALESYYVQKLINIANGLNANSIVWEEVFVNGVEIPEQTVVQVWKSGDYKGVLHNVTEAGKQAILSSCWYLDHLQNGGDWIKYYQCDPDDFPGTDEQKKLLIGGEACMWSEVVNEYNVMSRVWPRAAAPAEKLWSPYSNPSFDTIEDIAPIASRLEEHTCRMNFRGIAAQPATAPGVCL